MTLHFPTRAERTGKQPHIASLGEKVWPEFMYHDDVLDRLFGRVVAEYPEFLFYAWDDEREEVVGGGHAIPAAWDGVIANLPDGGIYAVVEARFAEGAPKPNVLCALQILIAPEYRGQGLSRRMIERLGADIVKVAPESMRVSGTVAEWEEWTELALPESGAYVVPGALAPIEIDRERDEGLYLEPNVWMVHSRAQASEP